MFKKLREKYYILFNNESNWKAKVIGGSIMISGGYEPFYFHVGRGMLVIRFFGKGIKIELLK